MTRPDWAAGPEWEGWEAFTDEDGNPGVFRAPKNRHQFEVVRWSHAELPDKRLAIDWDTNGNPVYIDCPSPESALRIANAIAAEFGGWA